jgi:hypothetical protein
MTCPIEHCLREVSGPLRLCAAHFHLVPAPLRQALSSFARVHKGGPAHRAAFARAVESVVKTLAFQRQLVDTPAPQSASLPYRDD